MSQRHFGELNGSRQRGWYMCAFGEGDPGAQLALMWGGVVGFVWQHKVLGYTQASEIVDK